jgi:arginine utilization protein RocB
MILSTPEPLSPQEVLDWYRKVVDEAIDRAEKKLEKQMKLYVKLFAAFIGAAGLLLTFAGWLGYNESVQKAVKEVKISISDSARDQLAKNWASDPKVVALVQTKMLQTERQQIESSLSQFVQLDTPYAIQVDGKSYLDIQTQGNSVGVVITSDTRHSWALKKKEAH